MALTEPLPGLLMLKDHASWAGGHSRRTGYAIHLPLVGVLALVDPPPLGSDECAQLGALGPPTHVLLTCNWHLRGGEDHRRRWGCPILIHEAGLPTAETTIDGTFRVGHRLWDSLEVVQHLTELGWREETAFLIHLRGQAVQQRRVLYVGDAICGGRDDIGLPEGEVGQYTLMGRSPELIARLIPDGKKARAALEHLLRYDFDVLAFGHGAPSCVSRTRRYGASWTAANCGLGGLGRPVDRAPARLYTRRVDGHDNASTREVRPVVGHRASLPSRRDASLGEGASAAE